MKTARPDRAAPFREEVPLGGRRIALISYSGPPVVGGVEQILGAQARWLRRCGAEVTVAAGQGERFHPAVAVRQLACLRSRSPRPDALPGTPEVFQARVALTRRRLARTLGKHDTWILHNVLTMPFNPVLTAALFELIERTSSTVINWVHDIAWVDDAYDTPDRFPWSLLKRSAPVDCHVAISRHRADQLQALYGPDAPPIRVVHDAVEVGDLLSLDPSMEAFYHRHELYRDDLIALYPTRLVRRKNIEKALAVVAGLRDLGNRVRLIVTGPGDPHNDGTGGYREALFNRADELGLNDVVIFGCREEDPITGDSLEMTFDRVKQLYRMSDLLLMPTRQEGFGIPLVEAGLTGTLICCSRREPLTEIAGEHAVYFDPDQSGSSIARTIEACARDDTVVQSRRRMRRNFSWPSVVRREFLPLLEEFAPARPAFPRSSTR